MSTRGTVGFVVDDAEKLTYNHSDSYPDSLGVHVLNFCAEANWDEVREKANRIVLVTEDTPPTEEQIRKLIGEGIANLHVSDRSVEDWYCLMREAQGDLNAYLDLGLMEDGRDFPLQSLFCEWAYVIDLDTNMLEVYRGFQKEPHEEGRFANRNPDAKPAYEGGETYHPVKLVAAWSLTEPPDETAFLAGCGDDD